MKPSSLTFSIKIIVTDQQFLVYDTYYLRLLEEIESKFKVKMSSYFSNARCKSQQTTYENLFLSYIPCDGHSVCQVGFGGFKCRLHRDTISMKISLYKSSMKLSMIENKILRLSL